MFWEHHPILLKFGKDPVRYGEQRRTILDAKGYSRIPLVVSCIMFKDQKDIMQRMSSMGVDFRIGKVPKPGITYILNLREEMRIELLMEPVLF